MNNTQAYAATVLRLSLGAMYVAHSLILKHFTFTLPGTAQFFESLGLPATTFGVVAANLLFVAALIVIFRVMTDRFGIDAARRGVILLAFSPAAFALSMLYSEPLFLLLAGLYFMSRSERAGVVLRAAAPLLAGASMFVRVSGLAIAASAAITWLRRRREHSLLIVAAAVGVVFAGWWVFIWRLTGDFWGWTTGSPQWQQSMGLDAIWKAIQFENLSPFTLLPIGLAVAMFLVSLPLLRRDFELGLFSAVSIAMTLVGAPISSMPRHAMVAFPVFGYLGEKLGHRKSLALAVVLAILQVELVVMTFNGWQPTPP